MRAKQLKAPLHFRADVFSRNSIVSSGSSPRNSLSVWLGFGSRLMKMNPSHRSSATGVTVAGYPFDKLTQVYQHRAILNCNWKLDVDGFQEGYSPVSAYQADESAGAR